MPRGVYKRKKDPVTIKVTVKDLEAQLEQDNTQVHQYYDKNCALVSENARLMLERTTLQEQVKEAHGRLAEQGAAFDRHIKATIRDIEAARDCARVERQALLDAIRVVVSG